MIKYIATLLLTVLFVACNNGKGQQPSEENEDPKAKEILQGIWLDDETETPLMRIIGDTIYYSDAQSAPVYFKILKDTLYTYGKDVTHYQIDKQSEYSFWFHSLADNI
ncbi:putative lipoprotein, partial [Bacteroides fragilis str. S13 L11]